MAQYAYVVARNTRAGIQLEIDKAHAEGGGLVFLPRGRYRIDASLRLKPNVHLTGVGEETVLEVDAAMGPAGAEINVIELDGGEEATAHDVEISKLMIRGPGASPDITQGVSSGVGKGCGIVAWERAVRNVVVRGCRIENTGGCGILFFSRSAGHRMENITIENCHLRQNRRPDESGMPSNYKDIYFYGAFFDNVRVENNVCTFVPTAASAYGNDSGIAFVGNGHGGAVRHARLTGNRCAGHRRHGLIANYGTMEHDGVFVSANRCENNGWAGLYVSTDATYSQDGRVVVSGNFCCNNGFWEGGTPDLGNASIRGGIVLNAAYHAVVVNNICLDNGTPSPAFIEAGVTADAAAVNAAGIRLRGDEHIVDGNLVKGNKNAGIAMWPGPVNHVSITNNRAVNNGRHGIVMAGVRDENARQIVITGNVCADNREHGIHGFYTDGALVASNYVFDNEKAGVDIARTAKHVRLETNFTALDERLETPTKPPSTGAKPPKTW